MTKQLQDISFILFDYCYFDSNTSSNTVYDISQLNSFLIHKLRNKRTTKKQYSENFNLIDVLKHESIRCPYDVKTNQKFIFIASVRGISVFHRLTRKHFLDITVPISCTTLCLDPNYENDFYVTGSSSGVIYKFKYNNLLSDFELANKFQNSFSWISNMVMDNSNNLYCVERGNHKIFILNKHNGEVLREINNNEQIIGPWSMILSDNNKDFLVASLDNKSIARLSLSDGKLINSFKEIEPSGMIVNYKTNHLLVCSYKMNRFFILDYETLQLIKEIDLDVKGPMGIDIDCDGILYFSEYNSNCVKIFN